jgi:thioesterase domain-containing protein
VVAFELAQQLTREGEEVSLLALLDASLSLGEEESEVRDSASLIAGLLREEARQLGRELSSSLDDFQSLELDAQLELALCEMRRIGLVGVEIDKEWLHRFLDAYQTRAMLRERYRALPYPGRITLFRAREVAQEHARTLSPAQRRRLEDPTLGWGEVAEKGVEVHPVPGLHNTMLLEPHVSGLAAILTDCITRPR